MRKFRQYATPPRGFLLEELRYQRDSLDPRNNGFFTLKTPGQQDFLLAGRADLGYGYTQLWGDLRRTASSLAHSAPSKTQATAKSRTGR